ncbi:MAG: hypothetical protein RIC18_04530 [Hoeflea sp.]|uniref:hypothetical protein n=1 Tax=Hoeflea sp. TaxID=1940281 RepID=UPI0032ECE060
MQIAENILHILAIIVLVAMAAKYGLAKGIQSYHKEIIADDAVTGNTGLKLVMGASYQAIGAGALAVAIAYAVLVFRVAPVTGFGKGYAFLITCVLALPALISTYRVEQTSGVKTPWRVVAVGIILAAAAYAISYAVQGPTERI